MKSFKKINQIALVMLAMISSAFHTGLKKNVFPVYAVWAIYPGQVSNPYFAPANLNSLQCGITEVLYLGFSSLPSCGYTSLEDFRANYDDGEIFCDSHSGYVCMAYVNYDLNSPTEGVVVDLLEGDFEHDY